MKDTDLQNPTTHYILKAYVDPKDDLNKERSQNTFNSREMTYRLYGKSMTEKKEELSKIISKDPVMNKEDVYFLNGVDLYLKAFSQQIRYFEILEENNISSPIEAFLMKRELGNGVAPLDLNFSMFKNAIESQGTDSQREYYLGKIAKREIIGTYAQTELGHGTFLRGLETTATYDKETEEFLIHSPTLTATKWWPGGLGKTSNYCVLMARLFIDGHDFGPHAFMVQLRDDNHIPLTGITLGDIGPKFGWNTTDNGFLRFDHVRIPRENMLMRHSRVSKEGLYEKPPHAKANYSTMIFVRSSFVADSSHSLGKAVCIATRYSLVRRQGGNKPGEYEKQVLDYKSQQKAIFPLIATAYAFHFTGKAMMGMYFKFKARNNDNDFSDLPELHATSAGLKAVTTDITSEGIETCRRFCGGHGFHRFSGLPDLLTDYLPQVTGEGVNPVLCLQTARYLLKIYETSLSGGKLPDTFQYLKTLGEEIEILSSSDFLNQLIQLQIFSRRVARQLERSYRNITSLVSSGMSFDQSVEENALELIQLAKSHCIYTILDMFIREIKAGEKSTQKPLKVLSDLFALSQIENDLGHFLSLSILKPSQVPWIHQETNNIYKIMRKDAIAYVDALNFSDYCLNSSLGRYDGDCYQDLFRRAQNDPRNRTPQGPAIHHIQKWKNSKSNL